jgi:predicted dehydrogenase
MLLDPPIEAARGLDGEDEPESRVEARLDSVNCSPMRDEIRWGILGLGSIARSFAEALRQSSGASLAAAGSRSLEKARSFAQEFGADRAFGTYEELVADPAVDAVYVATPHPLHRENVLMALGAGKAVLCEKPFALNAAQAQDMAESARGKGLFLMEGMWTRFFPIMARLRELLAEERIGPVRSVSADFGFRASFDPQSRLFAPDLGGGALLDVGVYCVSFATMVLGDFEEVASTWVCAPSGVDAQAAAVLRTASGATATFQASLQARTPWEATVIGEKGRIRIHEPFWKPSAMAVVDEAGEERIELPYRGNGFVHEIEEAGRCLREGISESPVLPLVETIRVMELLDRVRADWGWRYPSE